MKCGAIGVLIVLLVIPELAAAQGQPLPLAPPHKPAPNQPIPQFIPFPGPRDPLHWNSNTIPPTMPWYGVPSPMRSNYGSVIRYIEVPSQQVVAEVYVPGPGSFSGGFEPQLFEIPGYVVTETTTGYIYPARVGLREITRGVFNWVTEPPGFQPK